MAKSGRLELGDNIGGGRGLRAMYEDHLKITGKRADFLLVLIELFSLDVTAEALRANID